MDPASFSGLSDTLSFNASIISNDGVARISDFSSRLDSIQSPVVSSMGTGDLLIDGCEETLGIEESSQPERDGSVLSQPVGESKVSVLKGTEPSRQGRGEPGDFSSGRIKEPHLRYTEIEDELDALGNLRRHNNLTVNS
jgi:hypothetical protein